MEVDIEELGRLLYPNSNPENEDFKKYIIFLASCGLDKLTKENSHLKDEKNLILDETQNLVYKNYKTFIHSANCSQALYEEFSSVEDRLENLVKGLPTLKKSVENFLVTSRNLAQSRESTSFTLSKHAQLLEILEIPQLMDTCVRNCYYEDALEILAYVKRLEKKHLDIPIITSIITEVKGGTRIMLLQLLLQLRSSLTLPQCLKTVGYLKRLDIFSESELKLKFLQARDAWFVGLIKAIPKDDAFHHITKVVEVSRVHLFDIVTQYRAIFFEEESRFKLSDSDINEQAIFHEWILQKVNQFICTLEKDLDRGVGPNLESLLDQCMFFGQSFSRIGADFRSLLIPVFQAAAFKKFDSDVTKTNAKYEESLSAFSLIDANQLSSSYIFTEDQDKSKPPLALMEYSPLALYMNGLVNAFNGLRQCCPLALLKNVLRTLSQSLSKVVSGLADLHRLEGSGFTASEKASFERMCSLVATALIPHVNVCLGLLFPLRSVAAVTGVSLAELQKKNVGQLDTKGLIEPLESFLPRRPPSPLPKEEPQELEEPEKVHGEGDENDFRATEENVDAAVKTEDVLRAALSGDESATDEETGGGGEAGEVEESVGVETTASGNTATVGKTSAGGDSAAVEEAGASDEVSVDRFMNDGDATP